LSKTNFSIAFVIAQNSGEEVPYLQPLSSNFRNNDTAMRGAKNGEIVEIAMCQKHHNLPV
jgi:hypothetical protein